MIAFHVDRFIRACSKATFHQIGAIITTPEEYARQKRIAARALVQARQRFHSERRQQRISPIRQAYRRRHR